MPILFLLNSIVIIYSKIRTFPNTLSEINDCLTLFTIWSFLFLMLLNGCNQTIYPPKEGAGKKKRCVSNGESLKCTQTGRGPAARGQCCRRTITLRLCHRVSRTDFGTWHYSALLLYFKWLWLIYFGIKGRQDWTILTCSCRWHCQQQKRSYETAGGAF